MSRHTDNQRRTQTDGQTVQTTTDEMSFWLEKHQEERPSIRNHCRPAPWKCCTQRDGSEPQQQHEDNSSAGWLCFPSAVSFTQRRRGHTVDVFKTPAKAGSCDSQLTAAVNQCNTVNSRSAGVQAEMCLKSSAGLQK